MGSLIVLCRGHYMGWFWLTVLCCGHCVRWFGWPCCAVVSVWDGLSDRVVFWSVCEMVLADCVVVSVWDGLADPVVLWSVCEMVLADRVVLWSVCKMVWLTMLCCGHYVRWFGWPCFVMVTLWDGLADRIVLWSVCEMVLANRVVLWPLCCGQCVRWFGWPCCAVVSVWDGLADCVVLWSVCEMVLLTVLCCGQCVRWFGWPCCVVVTMWDSLADRVVLWLLCEIVWLTIEAISSGAAFRLPERLREWNRVQWLQSGCPAENIGTGQFISFINENMMPTILQFSIHSTFFQAPDMARSPEDKWISSPSHFHRSSPFNCCLSVVL